MAKHDGVTIYHNPKCSTSRTVLGMLRDAGIEPMVIEYLKEPPDRNALQAILKASGLTAAELIRSKERTFSDLGLDLASSNTKSLVDAMLANPVLINRPIVVSPKGTRLCRPADRVLDLIP